MEEEKQVTPEMSQPKPQPIVIHKSTNAPLVGAIIFLALVVGAAAIYLGMPKKDTALSPNIPSPVPSSKPPSDTPVPTAAEIVMQTFTSTKLKDISFPAYIVNFGEDWKKEALHTDITDSLTLTKDKYSIKIYQAPMGGGQCVFEGTMPEGPSQDFRKSKFEDLVVGEITLRRVEQKNGFSFCSNSTTDKKSYGSPSAFGAISYITPADPDPAIITEMDNIIKSLK